MKASSDMPDAVVPPAGAVADKKPGVIRRLYNWTIHWAATPYAVWALLGIAFIESSFFPIPPDVLLIAMALSMPKKAIFYAGVCTLGSVLGAVLGYGIGMFAFHAIGARVIDFYGLWNAYNDISRGFQAHGFFYVFVAALTPIPYKVFTIAAGACKVNLGVVLIASVLGRGLRFYAQGVLFRLYGPPIKDFIDRYLNLLTIAFVGVGVIGFVCVKFIWAGEKAVPAPRDKAPAVAPAGEARPAQPDGAGAQEQTGKEAGQAKAEEEAPQDKGPAEGAPEKPKQEENAEGKAGKAAGEEKKTEKAADRTEEHMLSKESCKKLMVLARQTVEAAVKGERIQPVQMDEPELQVKSGAFVTLKTHDALRGCIGRFIADQPVYKTVQEMAVASALEDPRFVGQRLKPKELPEVDIEISVLSPLEKIANPLDIKLGVHGIYIRSGYRSGCFLPQVATETGWTKEEFLSNCCAHKAGLPPDAWKDRRVEVLTFTAQIINEKDVKEEQKPAEGGK